MKPRRIIVTLSLGMTLWLIPVVAHAEDLIDTVMTKWKARQDDSCTVRVEIEEEYRIIPPPSSSASPEGDEMAKRKRTLILKGESMYHKRHGLSILPDTQSVAAEQLISVFDGTQARSLQAVGTVRLGFYHTKRHHADRWNLDLLPILLHFRAMSAELSIFSRDKLSVVGTTMKIGGSECVMLREGDLSDIRYREIWLAPDMEFALAHRRDLFEGRVANEVDIAYRRDEKLGWIPDKWQVDRYSNGRMIGQNFSKVLSLAINEPVEDSTFELEFPPGTKVHGVPQPKFADREIDKKQGHRNPPSDNQDIPR
jgi:hypothetical protein